MALYQDPVRFVFAGDSGTGKTTLIQTILTDTFMPDVPKISEPVSVPIVVNNRAVSFDFIDTSGLDENELFEEFDQANVICLVFSCDVKNSFESIEAFWMPLIEEFYLRSDRNLHIPIMVVQNKYDLSLGEQYPDLSLKLFSVESMIKCSSMDFESLAKMLSKIQDTAFYPMCHLISDNNDFLPVIKKVLGNIFEIIDLNNDGFLDYNNFAVFLNRILNKKYESKDIIEMFKVFSSESNNGIIGSQMNLIGFNQILLKNTLAGNQESIWKMLQRFSYNIYAEIQIPPEFEMYVQESSFKGLKLSTQCFQFLKENVFSMMSLDKNTIDFGFITKSNYFKDFDFKETFVSQSGFLIVLAFLFDYDPIECIKLLLSQGYTYYISDINQMCTLDQNRSLFCYNVFKVSLMKSSSLESQTLDFLVQDKSLECIKLKNYKISLFSWKKLNGFDLIYIDHSDMNIFDKNCILELDCSSEDHIQSCTTTYIANISSTIQSTAFVLTNQNLCTNKSLLDGTKSFCKSYNIPVISLSNKTSPSQFSKMIKKCFVTEHDVESSLICDSTINDYSPGGLFNMAGNFLSRYESYIFPATLVSALAFVLILRAKRRK